MESAPRLSHRKAEILLIIGGLVLLAAILAVYFFLGGKNTPAPENVATPAPLEEGAPASLGGEVFAKAANPVADELPSGSVGVQNPVEGLYKNPFE